MATEIAGQGVEMSQEDFNSAKSRIRKYKEFKENRVSDDRTKSKAAYDAIREAEVIAGQDGSSPLVEKAYHTEGYLPIKMDVSYLSPKMPIGAREACTEEVVVFVKAEKFGEYTWLLGDGGKPLAINAFLYDSRVESHRHPRGIENSAETVPQLDADGKVTGIITLFVGKREVVIEYR